MLDASAPFILFDDARPGGSGRLYRRPVRIIATLQSQEVGACLARLQEALTEGLHAAGFLTYEAGYALEPKLAPLARQPADDASPLLWFGLFEDAQAIAPGEVERLLPPAAGSLARQPVPLVERPDYEASAQTVKEHIEAGDIYQANLTFPAEVPFSGDPLALYASVRDRAQAPHGGIVFTGEEWLLSFSPELFFTLEAGRITTRPMKGTAKCERDAVEDRRAAGALRDDPKQRAENLMIVDLLRNDLSRLSKPGAVKVPALFDVETYPTVHQMTSTVTAEAKEGVGPIDILRTIFPCGSVTGAPKIRAMEIIAEVERAPRGAYTGSIGWVAPDGRASFNVAIRTLAIRTGESRGLIGLGSGIVADSRPADEWAECLAKGAFLEDRRRFDLIETMRFDPREGLFELERHLARMKRSAEELGFPFDRHAARNELQAGTFRLREPRKVRLLLSRSGAVAIEARPLPPAPAEPVSVAVVTRPVPTGDFRLCHKSSDRAFYDEARVAAGTFEVVFEDAEGRLTEGSFTNLFVERGGRLVTPPLERGLLAGVLREKLIAEGEAVEGDLGAADLADGFYIGNALRGLIRARLAG